MAEFRRTTFGGLRAVELRTRSLRLVAVVSGGPRLAFLGRPKGDNLLLWEPGRHGRGKWDLMGGHRLWTTRPGADEAEETYVADNAPCRVELDRGGCTLTAAPEPSSATRRGMRLRVPAPDRIEIEHFIRNEGAMLWSGGLWGLTCTVPGEGGRYTIPLGDGSGWDTAGMVVFRRWGGGHGTGGFEDTQFRLTEDALVLEPGGRENKRMIRADPGVIAMHAPRLGLVFAKRAAYAPSLAAGYPMGTNLALYVGPRNFMVEMETMGPAATLKPGEELTHTETWVLRPGRGLPTTAALQALFA